MDIQQGVTLLVHMEDRSDIETILSASDSIPKGELRVLDGSDWAKKLKEFSVDVPVSLGLLALNKYRGGDDYTIGQENDLTIVYVDEQATPLVVNSGFVERERKDFRDDETYLQYRLAIAIPSCHRINFVTEDRNSAPWASVPRYQKTE